MYTVERTARKYNVIVIIIIIIVIIIIMNDRVREGMRKKEIERIGKEI